MADIGQLVGGISDPATLKSWNTAKKYVGQLGPVATIVASCIRSITSSRKVFAGKNIQARHDFAVETVTPVIEHSPSLKVVLYEASKVFSSEGLAERGNFELRELIACFNPDLLVNLIGFNYFLRRLKKFISEQPFTEFSARVQKQLEIGYEVGSGVAQIGPERGMLASGIRAVSYGLYMIKDFDEYSKLMNRFAADNKLSDLSLEEERFGCNHLQISAVLMQSMGFGVSASIGIGLGLDVKLEGKISLEEESTLFKLAGMISEQIQMTGSFPRQMMSKAGVTISVDAINRVKEKIEKISREGSKYGFLSSGLKDVTPKLRELLKIKDIPDMEAGPSRSRDSEKKD